MVLSESDTIAYGSDTKPNSSHLTQPRQPLQEEEPLKDGSSFSPLSGQNSLLSLTLNEIQNKSGKSFGSMNMDEFLANLWNSVDENQDGSELNLQSKDNSSNDNDNNSNANGIVNPTPLARQGSYNIPSPLCKKTVDEVWFEIQKDEVDPQNPNNHLSPHEPSRRQQTLGELTLEDFLVKAGIVQESHLRSLQPKMVNPVQNMTNCLDASFGMEQMMGIGFSIPNGFTPYQMFPQNKGFIGEIPNNAKSEQSQFEMGVQQSKKRIINGPPEVVVERRQRRMIKNRESAARSRARKQAYTVELELELNQLKEENAKLKELVEEIEQNRKEEVTRRRESIMSQKKGYKMKNIRRTMSLTW